MMARVGRPYARPSATRATTSSAHRLNAVATRARSVLRFGLVWLLVALAAVPVSAQPPATNVEDPRLYEVAAELRCVVCQNLSVADSPSEMAQQMRVIIRERLAAGESPAQITQYFVDKYGEWILLSPRRSGFNLLVWGFPIVAIAVGLIVFALVLHRWTRRTRARMTPSAVDAAMSEWLCRDLNSDQ
jgi:cytochrome c-type biogenesis protein CcmH